MNPAAGRRLRDFVLTRLPESDGWSSTLPPQLGVTRTAVMAWFAGKVEPSMPSVTALAGVLGCRRWELIAALDGDGPG